MGLSWGLVGGVRERERGDAKRCFLAGRVCRERTLLSNINSIVVVVVVVVVIVIIRVIVCRMCNGHACTRPGLWTGVGVAHAQNSTEYCFRW